MGHVIALAKTDVVNGVGFLSQLITGNTKGQLLKVLVNMK